MFDKKRTALIAEIGSNHDGRLDRALKLINDAKVADADAVKFQSFSAETLVYHGHPAYKIVEENALPDSWLLPLSQEAKKLNLFFLSTPFNLKSLEIIASLNPPAIKIASGDLTYHELLTEAAKTHLPILLSTGHAKLDEIEQSLEVLHKGGAKKIVLMHCTSLYPTHPSEVHLRAMQALKSAFGLDVGFSDHTLDDVAALGAVALGALVIEKHFTDDRTRPGPDHPHSMTPVPFKEMVKRVRTLEEALGSSKKEPLEREEGERIWARRALYAKRAIKKGEAIHRDMVKIVRPANSEGVLAQELEEVLTTKANKDIREDELIRWQDLIS